MELCFLDLNGPLGLVSHWTGYRVLKKKTYQVVTSNQRHVKLSGVRHPHTRDYLQLHLFSKITTCVKTLVSAFVSVLHSF